MIKDLGIVIVNWKSEKELLECLKSLEATGFISDIVMVDNGSLNKLKNFKLKIIENKKNLGYAEGNNQGIKYLFKKGTKYILVLNPDTIIEKNAVRRLLKVMEKDGKVGIAGPKIYDNNNHIWSCGGVIDKYRYSAGLIGLGKTDKGQYDKMKEADYISGTAMLIRREVFETVGLFYHQYFAYYEDVELCVKARQKGFQVVFIPEAIIYHQESSSFGKDSPAHSYYMARNHLLFVERNAPFFIKIRELVRLPKTIWEHWQKKEKYALLGIRDYFLRRLGKSDYWN